VSILNSQQSSDILDLARSGAMGMAVMEANRPFRYSEGEKRQVLDRVALKGHASKRPSNVDTLITSSQRPGFLSHQEALVTARNFIEGPKPGLLGEAGQILCNLAWVDEDLPEVVRLSVKLMKPDQRILVRESGTSAVKNALFYPGPHVEEAFEALDIPYLDQSVRMGYNLVRGLDYARRHTNLPQVATTFLENVSRNSNFGDLTNQLAVSILQEI